MRASLGALMIDVKKAIISGMHCYSFLTTVVVEHQWTLVRIQLVDVDLLPSVLQSRR